MADDVRTKRFAQAALPHLDAAYNLARWLTRNDADAEDVVQEACVRALRYLDGFHGGDGRAWLLAIVRNTCFTWFERNRPAELAGEPDDDVPFAGPGPEDAALESADRAALDAAIVALPLVFREVLVLRELEELSYKEIAGIVGAPIGTVMSRLSRARALLHRSPLLRDHASPVVGIR